MFLKVLNYILYLTKLIKKDINDYNHRIIFMVIIIILLFIILWFRIGYLSVILSTKNNQQSLFTKKNSPIIQQRRDITDRNAILLATNLISYSLYLQPNEIINYNYTIKILHQIFPQLSLSYIKRRIKNLDYKGRIKLKTFVTPKQIKQVINYGLNGVYFHKIIKRIYPNHNLTAHNIGFVNIDLQGISGLELYLNQALINNTDVISQDLSSSLDIRVQEVVREELKNTLEYFEAESAAAVVLDINNGEVISLVSLPDFNPEKPSVIFHNNKYSNKATFDLYEVGSVFKIITFANALKNKKIKLTDKFNVTKPVYLSKFRIRDYHVYKPILNLSEVFYYSSNIGTIYVNNKLTRSEIINFYKTLGLLDKLNIELKEKSAPLYSRRWKRTQLSASSYGYGISISLLHISQAVASIISGKKIQVTLIKDQNQNQTEHKILTKDTILKMRKLLREVVLKGTGKNANVTGYCVGGKTGTANKVVKGIYDKKKGISSFIGVFPMNNPKYLVSVLFNEPKIKNGIKPTGGSVATPTVKNIISGIAPILNIKKTNPDKCNKDLKIYEK